jgi:hypothetical protein
MKEEIISEIFEWADNLRLAHDHNSVFLMHGDHRSAVTTISRYVVTRARNEGRLLASYFFPWMGEAKHRDPAELIPTIIYQIAMFDKDLLRRIADAIAMDRDIRDREADSQIQMLLDLPLKDASIHSRLLPLIVIDAVDACDGLDSDHVASGIGSFIAKLTSMTPLHIKIFITCRFPKIVEEVLKQPGSPPSYYSFVLTSHSNQVETSSVSHSDRGKCYQLPHA